MNTKNTLFLTKRTFLATAFLLLSSIVANAQTVFGFQNNTGDHLWSNAENWTGNQKPTGETAIVKVYADVIIDENVDILQLEDETTCELTVQQGKKLTVRESISWSADGDIILEDGAQLVYDDVIPVTVLKRVKSQIRNLVASPVVEDVTPTIENGFITDPETGYALFTYDAQNREFVSFKDAPFALANGMSYLYANALDTILQFNGTARGSAEPVAVPLSYYASNGTLSGCNFVGNPLACNAFVDRSFYLINEDFDALIAIPHSWDTALPPCQGIIVNAWAAGEEVQFQRESDHFTTAGGGYLEITSAKASEPTKVLDQAILSYNADDDLGKFFFFRDTPVVYFTKDGKDLTILSVDSVDVQSLKFDAGENGTYTLHFELKDLIPNYLHLIDNMTGANIDLLTTPQYTFNATTTDYASRFKLIFDPHYGVGEDGPSAGSEAFAYYANGEIIINDVETSHGASLQIIDMTGRVIMKRDAINRVSTSGLANGVYVLRLEMADGVRTQKIVIQ